MCSQAIADLISLDAIPVTATWSDAQKQLAGKLTSAISDLASDADTLAERAMRTLVLDGDCTGLAYADTVSGPTSEPVLCAYMRSEIAYSATLNPELAAHVPVALAVVECWKEVLFKLCPATRWALLGERPHPTHHRLVHFQLSILPAPAYQLVAAPLHRGICAKIAQLGQRDRLFDRRLSGFTRWVVRVVLALPADGVKSSLADYQSGEFDEIVQATIAGLNKQRIGPDGESAYSTVSRQTLWRDWQAIFGSTAQSKPFRSQTRRLGGRGVWKRELGAPDQLPETHPERRRYLALVKAQEEAELEEADQRQERLSTAKRSTVSGGDMASLDDGHACLAFNPSPSMPGALPRVLLALIHAGLDELQHEWCELNACSARALTRMMLYLGRRPEWLCKLRIGVKPATPIECDCPIFNPSENRIYYAPALYLGLPEPLDPTRPSRAKPEDQLETWREHDAVYEHIDLIHEIILPDLLAEDLDRLVVLRAAAIRQSPLEAAGLECYTDRGPLWLWLDRGRLGPLDDQAVRDTLAWLTGFVCRYIPDYPPLKVTNFVTSFDAYGAALGLRGEYRYYCSERARTSLEMPLRYSRVSSGQVYQAHSQTCARIEEEIVKEKTYLEAGDTPALAAGSQRNPTTADDSAHFGSWHCARLDIVQQVVRAIVHSIGKPTIWDSRLQSDHARHNALARWLAVALALLTGMRPFEIARLKRQNLDLGGLWLAVHGKPHATRLAFRRVPILTELLPALHEMLEIHGRVAVSSNLIGFYGRDGGWQAVEQADLESILFEASQRAGVPVAPDFYSLRHRFRTDMLASGMPEHHLNYLMGHESRGMESYSVYLDRTLDGLVGIYRPLARQLAIRYGLIEADGQR